MYFCWSPHSTLCNIWTFAASPGYDSSEWRSSSARRTSRHEPWGWGPHRRGLRWFRVVGRLPPFLIDNRRHLIWRRSNTPSIFVPPIRRTICCCPARRSLNLISFSRNQVLIVGVVRCGLAWAESNGFLSETGGLETVRRIWEETDGRLI